MKYPIMLLLTLSCLACQPASPTHNNITSKDTTNSKPTLPSKSPSINKIIFQDSLVTVTIIRNDTNVHRVAYRGRQLLDFDAFATDLSLTNVMYKDSISQIPYYIEGHYFFITSSSQMFGTTTYQVDMNKPSAEPYYMGVKQRSFCLLPKMHLYITSEWDIKGDLSTDWKFEATGYPKHRTKKTKTVKEDQGYQIATEDYEIYPEGNAAADKKVVRNILKMLGYGLRL